MANQSLALLGKSEKIITGLLGLGLLGILYLIVYGNLAGNLGWAAEGVTIANESGAYVNITGYTLDGTSDVGAGGYVITAVWVNVSGGVPYLIPSTNYSVSAAGVLTNASVVPNSTQYNSANVSYTYNRDSENEKNTDAVITNQTSGVVTFFGFSKTLFTLTAVTLLIGIVLVVISLVKGKGGRKDDGSPGFSG